MTGSTGCLFVYACPASLRAAVDGALAAAVAEHDPLAWSPHDGALAVNAEWSGQSGSGATLAQTLRALGALTFEVTEDAAPGWDGERFSFVPGLGLFRAATNAIGDVVVDENQLMAAVRLAPNAEALRERLARLVGKPWDDALEPFRWRSEPPEQAAAVG
ncbi:MAG: DUF3145 family protein [Actinomycetota bacterium]